MKDIVTIIIAAILLIIGYGGYAYMEIREDKKHEDSEDKL